MLGAIGRTLIAAGVLVLLFVGYQLWGTNLQEARSQDDLRADLEAITPSTTTPSTTHPTPTTATTTSSTAPASTTAVEPSPAPDDVVAPAIGEPVGVIRIPRIGVDKVIVSGVARAQLRKGPGHYPLTPLPGQAGNAAIAGHRTTYGAPFNRIDELEPGDEILIDAPYGSFRYRVVDTEIVKPSQGEVLEDRGDDRLTLTSCHPKYSARERIVVSAELVGPPVAELPGQAEQREERERMLDAETDGGETDGGEAVVTGADLGGDTGSRVPVVLWALVCGLIWVATWFASRLLRDRGQSRWVSWSPYVIGVPVFFVALYVCFENVANLLPANY